MTCVGQLLFLALSFSLIVTATNAGYSDYGGISENYGSGEERVEDNLETKHQELMMTLNETITACAVCSQVEESSEDTAQRQADLQQQQADIQQLMLEVQHLKEEGQGNLQQLISTFNNIINIQETRQLRDDIQKLREDNQRLQADLQLQSMKSSSVHDMFATLNTFISLQGRIMEREREEQRQLLTSLNMTVSSQGRMIGREREEQRQLLENFNTTITLEGRQSELEREEIWDVLGTLNASINHHSRMIGREREEQRQLLEIFNTTITLEGRQSELERKEIWEALGTLNTSINHHKCYVEAELLVNDNCSIIECQQGFLRPYQGVRAANITFSDLVAKNCVHLERTKMAWAAARANCVVLNGDLFVAGDLAGAVQYLQQEMPETDMWVGVQGTTWNDHRTVAQQEWFPGFPSTTSSRNCGGMVYRSSGVGVWHGSCTTTSNMPSICVKGVFYP